MLSQGVAASLPTFAIELSQGILGECREHLASDDGLLLESAEGVLLS